jgi:hypothetical protein
MKKIKRYLAGLMVAGTLAAGFSVAPAAVGAPGSTAEAYTQSSCRIDYKHYYGTRYSYTTCWRNYTAWEEWFQNGHDGYWRKQNYPYPGGWYYVGKSWYF